MKYVFMNDKTEDLIIHKGSDTTSVAMRPSSSIEISIPEGTIPFIKIWDDAVLLSHTEAKDRVDVFLDENVELMDKLADLEKS